MSGPGLDTVFVRWTWWRAVLHRGWWLVTSVYLVVDAGLSASQLILIGVAQAAVGLVFEVPAGLVADLLSRKWTLVVSHVLMGTAMAATGVVTGFVPLVVTQMVWGLSWALASGADVAWITDELDDPARISGVLVRSGRAQLTGAVAGTVSIGGLAWLTDRGAAMVSAGAAMLLLGAYVTVRFPERRFVAHRRTIVVRGWAVVRGSRVILLVLAATFLVNGVAGTFGRLYPLRLVDLGLPIDPVVWLTVLGLLAFLLGAAALRAVQPYIDGTGTVRRCYAAGCAVAALGTLGLAGAPEEVSGSAAVLLAAAALPVTRTFGTIWVNRETGSEVRATVHSVLAQAEYVGVMACGLGIAAVARFAGLSPALLLCGVLLAGTALLVGRPSRAAGATVHRG